MWVTLKWALAYLLSESPSVFLVDSGLQLQLFSNHVMSHSFPLDIYTFGKRERVAE